MRYITVCKLQRINICEFASKLHQRQSMIHEIAERYDYIKMRQQDFMTSYYETLLIRFSI